MNGKHFALSSAVAALTIAAATAYLLPRMSPPGSSFREAPVQQAGSSTDDDAGASSATPASATINARHRAYLAPSAHASLEAVHDLPDGDPDKIWVIGMLRTQCRHHVADADQAFDERVARGHAADSADNRRRFRHWHEARTLYCRGIDGDSLAGEAARQREAADKAADGSEAAAGADLSNLVNSAEFRDLLNDEEIQHTLWELALSSSSYSLTSASAQYLAIGNLGPFSHAERMLAHTALSPGMGDLSSRAEHVRAAAAGVYACRVHPVCGAGSLRALADGPPISDLHWMLGVEGLMRESFSPLQWRVIETIVADLMRCRQEGRGCLD